MPDATENLANNLNQVGNKISSYFEKRQNSLKDTLEDLFRTTTPYDHIKLLDTGMSKDKTSQLAQKGVYIRKVVPKNPKLQDTDHLLWLYDYPMTDGGYKLVITSNPKDKSKAKVILHYDPKNIQNYVQQYVEDMYKEDSQLDVEDRKFAKFTGSDPNDPVQDYQTEPGVDIPRDKRQGNDKRYYGEETWDDWEQTQRAEDDKDVQDLANDPHSTPALSSTSTDKTTVTSSTKIKEHVWITASRDVKTNKLKLKKIRCSKITADTASIINEVINDQKFNDAYSDSSGYEITAYPVEDEAYVSEAPSSYCEQADLKEVISGLIGYIESLYTRMFRYETLLISLVNNEEVENAKRKIEVVTWTLKSMRDTLALMASGHNIRIDQDLIDNAIKEDIDISPCGAEGTNDTAVASLIESQVLCLIPGVDETLSTFRCDFDAPDQLKIDQMIADIRYCIT